MNFLELLDIALYPAIAFLVGMMTVNLGHNTNRISISMERLEKFIILFFYALNLIYTKMFPMKISLPL